MNELQRRWRLVLGQESRQALEGQGKLSAEDQARDRALDYLYQREYCSRGRQGHGQGADQQPSSLQAVDWLQQVRKVFPKNTIDSLQRQAIERYGMVEILTDPQVLRQATPDMALVQTLLSFKAQLPSTVMAEVRRIIRTVCDQLEAVLAQRVLASFSGARLRQQHGREKQLAFLDWSTSLRRNLQHYNQEHEALVLARLFFYQRQQQRIPWDLFIVVDQSGSMVDSVVHTAVLAAIFAGVRSLRTHLILFDTTIVDMTDQLEDPVTTLLAVQLGGGTDIGSAMGYVAGQIRQAQRSLLVLLSDFDEGGDVKVLYHHIAKLHDAGVKLLGLSALDRGGEAYYNEQIARALVERGMEVASMSPEHLAQWVAEAMG